MDHSPDPKSESDDQSDDAQKKPQPAAASTIDAKTAREISENDDSPG